LASLLLAPPALAAEPAANPLGVGQPVRPALPASAYAATIRRKRAEVLAQLRQLDANGDYEGIKLALFISPFDDLRQACYFLPWAVVASDEAAGTALEDAYLSVRAAWKGLDDSAVAASQDESKEGGVSVAVAAFETALTEFERRIPAQL